jgi:hypothetical protein
MLSVATHCLFQHPAQSPLSSICLMFQTRLHLLLGARFVLEFSVWNQSRKVGFFSSLRSPSPVDIRSCHLTDLSIHASIIGNMTSAITFRSATRRATPVQTLTSRPHGLLRNSRSNSSSPLRFRVRASDLIHVALKAVFKNCPPESPLCFSRSSHCAGHVPRSFMSLLMFVLATVL